MDFIQVHFDNYDYTFTPSDKRFSSGDFIIPAFAPDETENYRHIWFCVDTSGSITYEMLSTVLFEIRCAVEQLDGLEGLLSFFDTTVTPPVEFEDEETLLAQKPVGGGGTRFAAIFDYMKKHMLEEGDELPVAVIILTDGECIFPKEEAALDVPVMWVICDSEAEPPWGKWVKIESAGLRERKD